LLVIREQFRQPRHRGHELHANPDEHQAAQHQQLPQRRGKTGAQGGKRIQEDAEGQHPASPENIGQVSSQQSEHAARKRRHEEQQPRPEDVVLAAGREACHRLRPRLAGLDQCIHQGRAQRGDRRLDDQRQHQELVDVEREPDRRDRAHEPGGEREPPRRRHARRGIMRSGCHAEIPEARKRRCRSGPKAYRQKSSQPKGIGRVRQEA
jgi:hypothetical protein